MIEKGTGEVAFSSVEEGGDDDVKWAATSVAPSCGYPSRATVNCHLTLNFQAIVTTTFGQCLASKPVS